MATPKRRLLSSFALSALSIAAYGNQFTGDEIFKIVAYWSADDRYTVSCPPEALKKGPFQVRLTPEGSFWLWNYNKARGLGKVAPTTDAGAQNSEQVAWERWIDAKVAYDRFLAAVDADALNEEFLNTELPDDFKAASDPGPIPEGLRRLAGDAPRFASAVQPKLHTVTFDDGMSLALTDNVAMRPRYAYYRFSDGVMSGGQSVRKMPAADLDALFKRAGITASEQRVMKAVSLLEGGFDSINTYDTGFVSVGFIQFACLSAGSGSLGQVLKAQKERDAAAFDRDFRAFGLDVTPSGSLVAVDPATGEETVGPVAAQTIIRDKRLIAVFQRAGRISTPFRVAQLRVAKERYYPADDMVTVNLGGSPTRCRVSEIVRSEAGMATLMDRKVNTGKLDPLPQVLANVVYQNGLGSPREAASFEYQVVSALRWRKDYLDDDSLSQPRFIVSQPVSRSGQRPKAKPPVAPVVKPKETKKAPVKKRGS
ncbi:MAG: hypothetical protein K1X67_11065 [Fimbriimonadaceae bacterium]|nr:hypothetical protein [Fimbriimonadaceae bacterium]